MCCAKKYKFPRPLHAWLKILCKLPNFYYWSLPLFIMYFLNTEKPTLIVYRGQKVSVTVDDDTKRGIPSLPKRYCSYDIVMFTNVYFYVIRIQFSDASLQNIIFFLVKVQNICKIINSILYKANLND